MAEATPKVGDRIINDHGTCVKIVNVIEGQEVAPGEVAADRVQDFLDAGYRLIEEDEVIPVQAHQVNAEF